MSEVEKPISEFGFRIIQPILLYFDYLPEGSSTYCQESSFHGIKGHRGVAQPGSAPALGAGGRWFKSSRPDQ